MSRKIESPKQKQNRHKAMEAISVINAMKEEFKNPLTSMNAFYTLYEEVYCKQKSLHDESTKVGTMCIQIPSEVIYALDSVPIRLCNGFYTDDEIGSDMLPQKACPLVKATVGHFASGNFSDKPDFIYSPTTCDQKTKAGATIESFGYEVVDVDFPRMKESEISREYFRRSIHEFSANLSRKRGKKLSRKKLKTSIAKIGYAQSLYHKLCEYRKDTNVAISGNDMFFITNAFFFDRLDDWIDKTKAVLKELETRKKEHISVAAKISPRIIYTGSPPIFPNYKIPMLIEQSDAVIVADETCSSNRMFNDMVAVDEWFVGDMLNSLADKYLKACTCPIFTKNDDRIRRIVDLYKTYSADGVIYQAFAGCSVYELEQRSVLRAMEKEGIPILYLESDYSPSQGGQLSTRVEAFVESLKMKKRKKA